VDLKSALSRNKYMQKIYCYQDVVFATMTELFLKQILSTGFSIACGLAVAIFGGFTAMIITWRIATRGSNLSPLINLLLQLLA